MLKLEKFIVQYTNKSKEYNKSAKFFMQYIFPALNSSFWGRCFFSALLFAY